MTGQTMGAVRKVSARLTLCAALGLAACGNDPNAGKGTEIALDMYKAVSGRVFRNKKGASAAVADPATVIQKALQANDGPLLMAVVEKMNKVSIMGPSGQNGPYRTWATPDHKAFSFNRGVLTSSRGLGNDLMSSEADPSVALITARKSGQVERSYQHLSGLGYTSWLKMACIIEAGERETIDFAAVKANTTAMVEICQNGPLKVQNLYWVDDSGRVVKSRQWLSGSLGYVTTHHLRF